MLHTFNPQQLQILIENKKQKLLNDFDKTYLSINPVLADVMKNIPAHKRGRCIKKLNKMQKLEKKEAIIKNKVKRTSKKHISLKNELSNATKKINEQKEKIEIIHEKLKAIEENDKEVQEVEFNKEREKNLKKAEEEFYCFISFKHM